MPYFRVQIAQKSRRNHHHFHTYSCKVVLEHKEASKVLKLPTRRRFCVGFDCFFSPFPNEEGVPSKKQTYHHFEGTFEDDFHFSKGYVCSLEGQFFFGGGTSSTQRFYSWKIPHVRSVFLGVDVITLWNI